MDKIITDLNNEQNYPDLNTILVTGHSAGAQYTYLYSATNPVEYTLNNKELLYAVANSSSYLYLNELREADSNYYIPTDCNNYNDWPFGLQDRNNYASNIKLKIITPGQPHQRGAQLSIIISNNGKQIVDKLKKNGVYVDWRDPNVKRLAPTPLYNSYEDIAKFYHIFCQCI